MREDYLRWSELPYAGETRPPHNPEEPMAGSWPDYFIRQPYPGRFETLRGRRIHLEIEHPSNIDWEDQLKVVKHTLRNLTPKQKEIAKYWAAGPASKQWTPIIDRLIDTYGVTAPRAARILAAVSCTMNDVFTPTWYLKYKWDVARPNQYDHNLASLLCTPRHPTYPSGHAAVAGATAEILSYFFPGERRRLHQLAQECADSRLYAGVHFPVDNEEGLRLGKQFGSIVAKELEHEEDDTRKPIDTPYRHNLHADLLPPPYKQAIPFDFKGKCDSLVRDAHCKLDKRKSVRNNRKVRRPRMYFTD